MARLLLLVGQRVDIEGGGHIDYRQGSIYLVDKATARDWQGRGVACDPDLPAEKIEELRLKALGLWVDPAPAPEPEAPTIEPAGGDS